MSRNRRIGAGKNPASMGPRPRGRGDELKLANTARLMQELQWVHGRAAVGMLAFRVAGADGAIASMGPRPRGRGDGEFGYTVYQVRHGFNGSTAARPW